MKLKFLLIILTILSMGFPAMASNALRGKAFKPAYKSSSRKKFTVRVQPVRKRPASITYEDVESIVPTEFSEDESSQSVVNRILQNSANAFMKVDFIANSFLMKTAKKVEDSTKMDIAIKERSAEASDSETEHRVNFDIQAFKAQAKITYTGLVDSKIEYQAANDTLLVSLEERLSDRSKIALSHLKDREESKQLLQYQFSW